MGEKREKQQSILLKSLFAGAIGAFIWGLVASISYFFSFSEVSHASFLIRSFFIGSWTDGIVGELISLIILSIIGIIPALIYYLFFKNAKGILPGILYGLALWGGVFILLEPFFTYVPTLRDMKIETIITTACQYILYGVFVGYTISYEHNEANMSLPKNSQNET